MDKTNTLDAAIELAKLAIQASTTNGLPLELDGKGIACFIREVKEGLDAIVEGSK